MFVYLRRRRRLVPKTSPEDDFTYLWDIYLLLCYKQQILFKWTKTFQFEATQQVYKEHIFNYYYVVKYLQSNPKGSFKRTKVLGVVMFMLS